MGGSGVKRRGSVGVIAVWGALYVLPKAPSPLEATRFDWVAWRVGVEIFMETCSTWWRLYDADSSVDLVGIAAFSCMRLTVVVFK